LSIISCTQCGKRISSLAPLCSYCGFKRGEASEEQLLVYRQRIARERVYRLNMGSYVMITLFVTAFGWYWWATAGFQQPSPRGPFILMGISGAAYLVVRGFLYQAKRVQKELKRVLR